MEYLLSNRVLIISVCAWITAQIIKGLVDLAVDHRIDFRNFVSPGGMPSSHSAIVTSLAVAVGKTAGVDSPLFAVSTIFAAIVMYDAAGVRRAVGIQAGILNKMLEEYFVDHNFSEKRLRELIGHTPLQVFAGAALGLLIALIWA